MVRNSAAASSILPHNKYLIIFSTSGVGVDSLADPAADGTRKSYDRADVLPSGDFGRLNRACAF